MNRNYECMLLAGICKCKIIPSPCICLSWRFWVLGLTRYRVLSILVLIFYWWISSSHCIRLCFSILSEIVSGAFLHLRFHEIYEHLFCFKKIKINMYIRRVPYQNAWEQKWECSLATYFTSFFFLWLGLTVTTYRT